MGFAVCKFSSAHLILFSRHRCDARQCRVFFVSPGVPTTLPRSASTTRGHRTLAAAHFKPAGLGFLQLFWHFCFCAICVAVRFSRTLEWCQANLFLNEENLFQKVAFRLL